ncbi:DUF6265 family protein [Terricaulis sp.]|uniref:DUF6265 family protein n=1 Tax=Terricaulis sp. TaxID=2768686 RepID=UPI002AC3CB9D|nr:DUF6265 family protein [Terricaulis sp.]MDZ4690878.1 DUF6265 family protein [Terricaulis sp.]
MRALVMGLAVLAASCGVSAQDPSRALPGWMSGYWLSCADGETAENWIGAGRSVLLGTNLSDGGYEFLRIAANAAGEPVYYSMPGGRAPPTEFVMTSHAGQRIVFENAAHDFPKRISYSRDGDVMTARIDGGEGSEQAMEWRFQRAEADSRCPS